MYDETAKTWESIVSFYRDLADHNTIFSDMASLARLLSESPYRAAGLCALTSMHDLILGPTKNVLDNPNLIVRPDFKNRRIILLYQDGSLQPWTRTVEVDEAYSKIAHVITTYAHWYHES